MTKRNIAKNLHKKVEEWLKTLPTDVAQTLKSNILISGGCIPSLVMEEDLKDYDIYLQSKESVKVLAEHYTKTFNTQEGRPQTYPSGVLVIDGAENNEDNYSGAMINLSEDRIKLWLACWSGLIVTKKKHKELPEYAPIALTSNSITLKGKIQIVLRFHGDADQIHKNFDFLHCTATYRHSKVGGKVKIPSKVYDMIINKRLEYVGSLYPLASMFRIRKFLNRGYVCPAATMLKIALHISELDFTDPAVLEEQLTGVDIVFLGMIITEIQKIVKEGRTLDKTLLLSIIDKCVEDS